MIVTAQMAAPAPAPIPAPVVPRLTSLSPHPAKATRQARDASVAAVRLGIGAP
jgi:hypothetical protein